MVFSPIHRLQQRFTRRSPRFDDWRSGPAGAAVAAPSRRRLTWSQLTQLPGVLSAREKPMVAAAALLLAVALVWLGTRFYLLHTVEVPKPGGEYTEGLVGNPKYINPILAQTNDTDLDLSRLIFSSLFTHDTAGKLVPDLVTTYEVSDDQKTYTLHLRADVRWHDDELFTANDVLATIDDIQTPEIKSPLAANLRGVTAEAPDDQTIVLTLKEPFAPFLDSLTFGILPLHVWENVGADSFSLAGANLSPIGTGPYKFDRLKKDRSTGIIMSYDLIRNEQYYNQAPYIEKLHFTFYPDLASLVEAGRRKNVDGLGYIPKESKTALAKNHEITSVLLRLPQYTAVFLNQKNSLLKIAEVKQALAYAIDKEAIINDVLHGEGEPINGPILPGSVGYNPEIKKYAFEPATAADALEKAGWKLTEDSDLRRKGDQELRFTLTTIDQPDFVATANMLKDYWQNIGIGVELRIIDASRIERYVIKPRDYEALLVGEIVGTDPDPYAFWHSSQGRDPGLNLSVFVNKDVDQLLEEARKTNDTEQRRLKYLHFQNILADELPAIFLYNPTYTYGLPSNVKGFALERITVPADRFTDIQHRYIKTQRRWE